MKTNFCLDIPSKILLNIRKGEMYFMTNIFYCYFPTGWSAIFFKFWNLMTFVTIFGISTSFLNILENEGSQRTSLITHPSPNHPLTHPPPTNPSANFCISRNHRCKGIIGPQGKTTAPYFDEFAVNVGWVDPETVAAYNIYDSLFHLKIYLKC